MPAGRSFIRYCASLLGTKPYQIPLTDPRAADIVKFYRFLDQRKFKRAMERFADDAVIACGNSHYAGKPAIERFLRTRPDHRWGQHQIVDLSMKNNQIIVLAQFAGVENEQPVLIEFFDFWVLNRSGEFYYLQSSD